LYKRYEINKKRQVSLIISTVIKIHMQFKEKLLYQTQVILSSI